MTLWRINSESPEWFVVSRAIAFDHGDWETMIFKADKNGNVLDWLELYAHRGFESTECSVNSYMWEGLNNA